jgi:hypothetical protein
MQPWRIVPIGIGGLIILYSFWPGMRFYPRALGVGSGHRTTPKWLGRLWFIFIGLWPITLGLSDSKRMDRIFSTAFPLAIGVIFLCTALWWVWMPDPGNEKGRSGHAWRGKIIVLLVGIVFLCLGLRGLYH